MALIEADGTVVLSPTDLTVSADCEFGWLRHIDVQLGRVDPIPDDDQFLERIARLGDAHEERELQRLRHDRQVLVIDRPQPYTVAGLAAAARRTCEALRDNTEVVAQAALFDGRFGGFADFLILGDDGRYQVWDAKLARHAKVTALLQIAAYADQLDQLRVPRSPVGYLLLGDRTLHTQALDDVAPVYRHRRDQLADMLAAHLAQPAPVAWGDDRYRICGACAHCAAAVEATDDVLQVAGLTRLQRNRLRAGGIRTVEQLAGSTDTVPDLAERTWRTLRAQAQLQARGRRQGFTGIAFDIFDPTAMNRLPDPDAGDIFFDFEGDPLWTDEDGASEGLEYLFGVVDLDEPGGRFQPFWAHDRTAERQALVDFLDYVTRRRERHPGLHIYHYAAYEPSALKRLTARHATGEDQLDDLLRAGAFVDLYSTVRQSMRVSAPSYSIKKLEPLYMGDDLRDEAGVTTAADSILQYHEFLAARADGDTQAAAKLLDRIADYNRYDCVSTWRLRDWLLAHRPGPAVTDNSADADGSGAASDERGEPRLTSLQQVADRLLAGIPEDRARRDAEQQGVALLAAALGFYRREAKPMWWAYFDHGVSPVDEWLEPRGALVAEHVEVVDDWHKPGKAHTFARTVRLIGRLDPGTSLAPGVSVCGVYEDVPAGWELDAGACRAIGNRAIVSAVCADDLGRDVVDVVEKTKKGQQPHAQLPMAVFEHTYIPADVLEDAIGTLADQVFAAQPPRLPDDAACDLLARRPPRLGSGAFDAGAAGDEVTPALLAETVERLDDSYLAVQGPPGTGKTHVGCRAVVELVRAGWKVGVVAQSHATVEHFLDTLVAAGLDAERVGKKPKGSPPPGPRWTPLRDGAATAAFLDCDGGRVLGGTAWTFAATSVRGLDLLVIDEAGQFSLANTIAVSRAARRLLLLGDPQQLPQVHQGAHPEPVQTSALGWLLDGRDTIPPHLGYFLARSWRMHSALTRPVSDLAYDGRLWAQISVTDTRQLTGIEPGLHPVPVPHTANRVASPEEARSVVELVRHVAAQSWRPDAASPARPARPDDVIVVAPYNAQVALLRRALDAAGFTGTPVGTVDRFQGQEAAVAIVSLAASSAADIPRGLEFLLDRHRLNVAISRGQWAAYLVHSPALADTVPGTVDALTRLGAFLRLTHDSRHCPDRRDRP